MQLTRRTVVKLLATAGLSVLGLGRFLRGVARAAGSIPTLQLRPVAEGDAPALQAIMQACVYGDDSFYGKCGEWSLAWAQGLIRQSPATPVLVAGEQVVAFLELPSARPAPAAPPAGATPEELERYAVRERSRVTFRVSAAGIRYDLLPEEEAVPLFETLLYHAFRAARAAGFEYVEAYAPWERHPLMTTKWTDYPGCELVQPPARAQNGGHDVYWLRWKLDLAIDSLGAEELLDVA
jgi:hypothetical protein